MSQSIGVRSLNTRALSIKEKPVDSGIYTPAAGSTESSGISNKAYLPSPWVRIGSIVLVFVKMTATITAGAEVGFPITVPFTPKATHVGGSLAMVGVRNAVTLTDDPSADTVDVYFAEGSLSPLTMIPGTSELTFLGIASEHGGDVTIDGCISYFI